MSSSQSAESSRTRANTTGLICAAQRGLIVAVLLLGLARSLNAQVLDHIPADCSAIISFRDPTVAAERMNALARHCGMGDIELTAADIFGDLQERYDLPPGAWDPHGRVTVIATRPEFGPATMIIAFSVKHPAQVRSSYFHGARGPRSLDTAEDGASAVMRGSIVYVANRRRAMRAMRIGPEPSLNSVMDETEKSLFAQSDVFVRVNVPKWKDRLDPFVMFLENIMKMGVSSSSPAEAQQQAEMMDWLFHNAHGVLDQMQGLTLAIKSDEKTLSLTHHHSFSPQGGVSQYLGTFEPGKIDTLAGLPDRPFLMLFANGGQKKGAMTLTDRVARHALELKSVQDKIPATKRQQLIETMDKWYADVVATRLMLALDGSHIQILTTTSVRNPLEDLNLYRVMQEGTFETMSVFMPGGYPAGKFVDREQMGQRYLEMELNLIKTAPKMREQFESVYGKHCKFQIGAIGPNLIGYTMCEPPCGMLELAADYQAKRLLGGDAGVRKAIERIPPDAKWVGLLDLGSCLREAPQLAALGEHLATPVPPMIEADSKERLIAGWGAVIHPHGVTGTLSVETADIEKLVQLGKKMAPAFKAIAAKKGGSGSN